MNIEEIANTVKAAKDAGVPVDKFLDNSFDKPTSELGEGLANLFWLVFSPIHAARASLEPRIHHFRKNLEEKLSKIPSENLVEPPLNIVGPALESAKYYIDDENISEMFAKLISSSMDSRNQNKAHPAFVEIIKQLSPFDASNLKFLVENQNEFGIINIDLYTRHPVSNASGSTTIGLNILPFPGLDFTSQRDYLSSQDNLERLKIIEITFDRHYLEENKYAIFENHPFCQFIRDTASTSEMSDGSEIVGIRDRRGIWGFTSLGRNFATCCLG
ncbi:MULTISPECIES: DUF4393 domain-containing protein [Paenibacillus]|uniref:DUF4393 domain-containing protein n=1 Tax=Paenibacillus lautus TaxID=1401 RepID=A0A1R1AMC2_PAELA|nr:DUF4393 domain-containing protein [Paenibacillus lautus]OME86537.1 hypothetical protein BK123_32565 [Paenibacillus lautus]